MKRSRSHSRRIATRCQTRLPLRGPGHDATKASSHDDGARPRPDTVARATADDSSETGHPKQTHKINTKLRSA